MSWRPLTLLAGLILTAARTAGLQEPRRVAGFFTNMRYHRESGDVLGAEVFIPYSDSPQQYVYVQLAEGVPAAPQLVPVTITENRIAFTLPEPNAALGSFTGAVTRDSLIGKFARTGYELRLHRGSTYWR